MKFPAERGPLGLRPLNEMIERSARLYGSNTALRKRGGRGWTDHTYSALFSSLKRVANYLRTKGRRRGDLIGIVGENGPEWVSSFLAVQWIGAVAVPLDARARETEISHIIAHSGLRTVFASQRFAAFLREMIERGDLGREIEIIPMQETDGSISLPRILSESKDEGDRESVNLQDLAVVQYTSGTTGNPKAVMLTQENISSNIDSLYQAVVFDQRDRFFSVLPIHHVYEGTAGNWLPLSVGASVTYSRSLKSKEMIEDARDTEPTVMLAVPLLLEKMLLGIEKRLEGLPGPLRPIMSLVKRGARFLDSIHKQSGSTLAFSGIRRRMGFGKLRFFVSGGAALPPWVQEGLEGLGFVVLQGYGLSETSPVLTLNPPRDTRQGSIGLPIPGVEIRILDPDPQGKGEIIAKGGNVTRGYYRNEEATRSVFTPDGFLLTGDAGYEGKDGFLYISGRKKSIIVTRGGENVFPEEIEGIMLQSPFIEEILVLRGRHPKTGDEEVQAIVYPKSEELERYFSGVGIERPGNEDVAKVIRKEIDERGARLAPYKRITRFSLRSEEFPKTTTNKIKRYLFEGQSVAPFMERENGL